MLNVMESCPLTSTQTTADRPLIYTQLAVDSNSSAHLQWAQKFPGEVAKVMEIFITPPMVIFQRQPI